MKLSHIALCLTLLLLTGCRETPGGEVDNNPEGAIRLNVTDGAHKVYGKSAEDYISVPQTGEGRLADRLSLWVFDESGIFLAQKQVEYRSDKRVTGSLHLERGARYLYLFSHLPQGTLSGLVPGISTKEELESYVIVDPLDGDRPLTAAPDAFLIGKVWSGPAEHVYGIGTSDNPETIPVNVGRAVARVKVTDVPEYPAGPHLRGVFTDAVYCIGSVATRYYLVGQYTGVGQPPYAGAQVVSAVHNEPATVGGERNPVFRDYEFPLPASGTNIGKGEAVPVYYIPENTTAPDTESCYGNTTHLRFRVRYLPDFSEVYCGRSGRPRGTLSGDGTFWTAVSETGLLRIYDCWPEDTIGVSDIKEYKDGYCYYSVPVRDDAPTEFGEQCRVLRNHCYEISVEYITGLGDPVAETDPESPVCEDDRLGIATRILAWAEYNRE